MSNSFITIMENEADSRLSRSPEVVLPVPLLPLRARRNLVRALCRPHARWELTPRASIIGSLAGTSYFGPVAGHDAESRELNEIRAKRKQASLERAGTVRPRPSALTFAHSYIQHIDSGKYLCRARGRDG